VVKPEEQRRVPRYDVRLPIRVTAIDGQPAYWVGQTRDIGFGGVRFDLANELPIARTVEYMVTLSDHAPAVRIICKGNVLRCIRNSDACFEIAVTMTRYWFAPHGETLPAVTFSHDHSTQFVDLPRAGTSA
jgi:hypothetical protein